MSQSSYNLYLNNQMQNRLYGFDYLRVFCMLSVLYTHNELISKFAINHFAHGKENPNWYDIIAYQLRACSVPSLVLISLILFISKDRDSAYLKKRLKSLFYLFVVWSSIYILSSRVRPDIDIKEIFIYIYTGGISAYYFINNLIILTIIIFFFSKKKNMIILIMFAASLIYCFCQFLWLTCDNKWLGTLDGWRPTSFLMMPFAAILIKNLIKKKNEKIVNWTIVSIVVLSSVFALFEWQFKAPFELIKDRRTWLPWHSRVSNHLLAMAIVMIATKVRHRSGTAITYLSRNALGIYCFHWIIIWDIVRICEKIISPHNEFLSVISSYILVFFCSLLATIFLKKAMTERLV